MTTQRTMRGIIGPPGTGKTSTIARTIAEYIAAGIDPDYLQALSFTRVAAAELGERAGLPESNTGTIHARCYRMWAEANDGEPRIAVDGAVKIGEGKTWRWNDWLRENVPGRAALWAWGTDDTGTDDGQVVASEVERLRNRETPQDEWPSEQAEYYAAWRGFLDDCGAIDFTDLIESAADSGRACPGEPAGLWIDEAQDMTPLEHRLVCGWAEHAAETVLVGDDDQALYGFRGGDPRRVFDGLEVEVLAQSWRCPRRVSDVAQSWMEGARWRVPKHWEPRADDGEVIVLDEWDHDMVATIAEHYAVEGSVFVLSSAGWQVNGFAKTLRDRSAVYGRPGSDRWNPFSAGTGLAGHTGALRGLCVGIVRGEWSAAACRPWVERMRAEFLVGKKKDVKEAVGTRPWGWDGLGQLIVSSASTELAVAAQDLRGLRGWIMRHWTADAAKASNYGLGVIERHGVGAWIAPEPKIWPSTIHGSKGSEADTVLIDLGLSGLRAEEWQREQADETRRRIYVGLTRARRRAILLAPQRDGISVAEVLSGQTGTGSLSSRNP